MKKLFIFFSLFILNTAHSFNNGDIILSSLNCRLCQMIEAEDGSSFSHVGIIIKEKGEIFVLQALGSTNKVSLNTFLKASKEGHEVAILRHEDFLLSRPSVKHLLRVFYKKYSGRPYDSKFSWSDDELYCSEFVIKFLNEFLKEKIRPNPMSFDHNHDLWERYFNGKVPHGEPGFSPNDFLSHRSFIQIKILK